MHFLATYYETDVTLHCAWRWFLKTGTGAMYIKIHPENWQIVFLP